MTITEQKIQDILEQYPGRKYEIQEWRTMFPDTVITKAEKDASLHYVREESYWYGPETYVLDRVYGKPKVQLIHQPEHLGDTWKHAKITCTCRKSYCEHAAAVLLYLERKNGAWVTWETKNHYYQRREQEERDRKREERKKEAKKFGLDAIPALNAFLDRQQPEIVLFDMEKALSEYTTTPYAIHRMDMAALDLSKDRWECTIETRREGDKYVAFMGTFRNELEEKVLRGTLYRDHLTLHSVLVPVTNRFFWLDASDMQLKNPGDKLDEYELAAIRLVWDAADTESKSEVTDLHANRFFTSIRKMRTEKAMQEASAVPEAPKKKEVVELLPRIVAEAGFPILSFKIGLAGGRKYVLKNCYTLFEAVEHDSIFPLGKKEQIDFSKHKFTREADTLIDFIQRNPAQSTGGLYQIPLDRSRLDNFYDMNRGGVCELLDKTNNIKDVLVPVDHKDIHFQLTGEGLTDVKGHFLGVSVSGFIPVLLSGNSYQYVLDRNGLSRISDQEEAVLRPFIEVADAAGFFRFQVGKDRLAEFYYKVLPGLLENPFVEYIDHCSEEAAAYLPPEPRFIFYVDLENDTLSLQCEVRYENKGYYLYVKNPNDDGYRDQDQEREVREAIMKWLPHYDQKKRTYSQTVSDDQLYDFLTSGIAALEFYGEVRGSSAFRSRKVIQQPTIQVGISVDSGNLLDISVTSKDLSTRELLDLYKSYQLKKRYYRISSGDFIDLTHMESLQELETFLKQIDLEPAAVIREKTQIPIFRALYLNKRLEEHDKIVSSRDRTYRALIRGFKTVRDAEFEVPEQQEEVLRPYQVYGYKWLKTLQTTGFGGILADEMGLGKTLQMISLFEENRQEQVAEPSLVVCPASLIYNWQEEIERFAPDLHTCVIAGTTGARKKLLAESSAYDVLITSYDLLKRDIALYEDMFFCNCVLDEAQYIKNAKSAAAKSVKLIRAKHRFALTGTPIENRLSELWSIFDFLMPGFLYSQMEFEKRFEIPIVKQKDEDATRKLKDMTSPFILRRLKTEVLSDLPEKLEEVRYARISGEQQRIYDAQVVRMKEMLSGGTLAGEEKIKIFAELMRIRQICCDPSLLFADYHGESAKREACMDLIQSAIEGGHRMLVFSQFVSMLSLLEQDLNTAGIPYYIITGSTPKEKRTQLVRDFNEGDVPVFLISLKAGGTGLNLTGADVVIHYDPWWNLSVQNQATDRAHRIGQTKQVTVFKLIIKNTIEERIMEMQNAKQDLAEAILEGSNESLMSLSPDELLALLG